MDAPPLAAPVPMQKQVIRTLTPEQFAMVKAGGLDELNELQAKIDVTRDRLTRMMQVLEPRFAKDPAVNFDLQAMEFWTLVPMPPESPAAATHKAIEEANPVVGSITPVAGVEAVPVPPAV